MRFTRYTFELPPAEGGIESVRVLQVVSFIGLKTRGWVYKEMNMLQNYYYYYF